MDLIWLIISTVWVDLFWVTIQGDYQYRNSPEKLDNLWVQRR